MNAPYDGDRGQGAGGEPRGQYPPPPAPPGTPRQGPYAQDPYLRDAYASEPYPGHDPAAQDPVDGALYDRSAHPAPPPGAYRNTYPQQQPGAGAWPPAPSGPSGPAGFPAHGDDDATKQFAAVDGFDRQDDGGPRRDAFAHLYRDQQQPYEPPRPPGQQIPAPGQYGSPVPPPKVPAAEPAAEPEPAASAAPASAKGGKAASLLKSSALMAAGTMVSRLLGFGRNLVMAAAIGVGTLNDDYQVANVLPTMIYILVGGGALNAVFIPQLVRAMKNDDDGGEAYANRLLTLVVVLLAGVTTVCVLGAPLFIQAMSPTIASDPDRMEVAVAFARYCLPTMFFMGVHVVLGQILNARGKFGAMMWTPVLNNIIIIATFGSFIWAFGPFKDSQVDAAGIPAEGVQLIGIGTLLGLVVQALAMLPYLREAGFRIRPRFDWRGQGLGKAAGLAKWTFFFVLANQLSMVVVTQLATKAGALAEKAGHTGTGITAYNFALQLWQMPQAIITVSVMTAVLPRISRAAHDGDASAVRDDLSHGLRTSAVAIVPCAFAFLALGVPMSTLMFSGGSGTGGATNIGFILMAFGLGLIPYSAQYVILRGFYAYEDTRTPFYNTLIVSAAFAASAVLSYLVLPSRWAVAGMAFSYGLGYAVGVGVAWRRLRTRLGGDLDGSRVVRTYARLAGACIPAALVGGAAAYGITQVLGQGVPGSLASLTGGGLVLLGVFYLAAKRMRIEELTAMVGMVRGRLGR
ncbi:murein biosynthesis integral membrane protein MurJ [Streptomyces telluris]|uniref:Murein biosynthesis integral membrane protein MurJ n=1 Tax=Streptomyces telluris TaxID=2720021 RepID=A0A9X2LP93_9ACTN|nr:murein biosynthesis integral membrane protein MurJ [Streptomyces telluris]MCQ8774639.1 murein biosynthesis integral membrane protein MurJ [Streptomyces telluris]NJP77399.1 murein biosynthesis integral membrane protein MurJ [Streptomyces telluris]